jgi:CubicO group peptidase (beta-lactamase class C family)
VSVPAGSLPGAAVLEGLVAERLSSTGAQLVVHASGGRVADVAVGDAIGASMESSTVHNTYCLSKFVLSVGVAATVAAAGVGDDTLLGELGVGGDLAALSGVSLSEVLDHAAGASSPSLVEYRMSQVANRPGLVRSGLAERVPGRAYSEVVFGLVMEQVIESLSGVSAAEFVYRELFEPVGIAGTSAVEPVHARALLDQGVISAPVGGLPVDEWPMLSELLAQQLDDLRPGAGVIWSMRDAATFASAVLDAVLGRPGPLSHLGPEVFARFCAPTRDAFFDGGAKRELRFASGMMVGPPLEELCPAVGPRAFGHLAGVATAVLLCDPDNDVVVALYLNGVDLEHSLAALDRSTVVRSVYEELGVR